MSKLEVNSQEVVELLLPFAQAYFRMLYYGSTAEGGSPHQHLEVPGYELLAEVAEDSLEPALLRGEQDKQLSMEHLGRVHKFLKVHGLLPAARTTV